MNYYALSSSTILFVCAALMSLPEFKFLPSKRDLSIAFIAIMMLWLIISIITRKL